MSYAKIENGAVARYPYTFAMLRQDNPDVSFPRELGVEWLAREGLGVVAVTEVERPEPSSSEVNVVEWTPTLVGGVWTQAWSEVPAGADEIASRQRRAVDDAARISVKADAFVGNFIAMTPAQVSAYINTNVTSLATAKPVIEKLALMVLLLARTEFRD